MIIDSLENIKQNPELQNDENFAERFSYQRFVVTRAQ